jgi:MFS family permease
MAPQVRTLVAYANFLLALGIGVWSLYLISMPLHPAPGDSHGGLLAVFSGMFLLPIALAAFAAGRLFQRQSRAAWVVQLLALALVAALVLALAQ